MIQTYEMSVFMADIFVFNRGFNG